MLFFSVQHSYFSKTVDGNNYLIPVKGQTITIIFLACIKILVQEPEQNIGLQLSQQVHYMQWSIKGIKISKVSGAEYNAVGLVKCLFKV